MLEIIYYYIYVYFVSELVYALVCHFVNLYVNYNRI
jgi:hypothetical protein